MKDLSRIAVCLIYPDGFIETEELTYEYNYHSEYIFRLWKKSSRFKEIVGNYDTSTKDYDEIAISLTLHGTILLLNNAINEKYEEWVINQIIFHYRVYAPLQFFSKEQLLIIKSLCKKQKNIGFLLGPQNYESQSGLEERKNFQPYTFLEMQNHIKEEQKRLQIPFLRKRNKVYNTFK